MRKKYKMEEKYETLYYIYKDIKYNTLEEVEKIIQEEKWDEIYSFTYNYIIFQIKFWIFLFLIFQIINNLVKYIDSKRIRFRSPIYVDENF